MGRQEDLAKGCTVTLCGLQVSGSLPDIGLEPKG